MERDASGFNLINKLFNFNSHAHVERDRFTIIIFFRSINFNSHAHVERDEAVAIVMSYTLISTHTLTWSVTYCG